RLEEAVAEVTARTGAAPLVVATTARHHERTTGHAELLEIGRSGGKPLLLLFGTGWGLADRVLDRVDHVLAPIRGFTDYNHLSVRSAAAIVLDRLFGDRSCAVAPSER